jgi:membrane protein DedA with SNARE-associated domain/membrane-associated phospholipid phosphatase
VEALLAQVIDWVKDHPTWSLIAVFVISVSESLAVVGLFVPGVIMMGTMGALIAAGAIGFWPVALAAVLGAILGDGLSFWLGHYFKDDIRRFWPFNRYPESLNFGMRFFDKYGSLSIVFGRFVGPVRPIIPVVAGMMGMAPTRFTVANVISALLWAPAYIAPGILLGASVKLAAETTVRLAIVLVGLLAAVWLMGWLVGRVFRLISPHASAWVQALLRWGELHPKVGEVARALADPEHPDARTLTALAGVLTLGVALFAVATGITVLGAGELRLNRAALELALSLSSPLADHLMLGLSRLADLPVILTLILVIFGYERLRRGGRQVNYWLAAGGFALLTPPLLQVLLRVPRPDLGLATQGGIELATTFGQFTPWAFPSGHVLRATVMFGFLAVALARTLPPAWRGLPYVMAAALVTAVAVARVYLGVEWLTGVLATIALGLVWVAALGLAFRRHSADEPLLAGLWPLTIATLTLAVWVQTSVRHDEDLAAYRPPPAPIAASIAEWQTHLWQTLPAWREDIWHRHNQPLDLQYVGSPEALTEALAANGWEPAQALDWTTALNLFSPELPLPELPVPLQVHAGHHEAAALAKRLPDGGRLVLRLWSTPYRLDGAPLWLGNVTAQRKDLVLNLFAIPATVRDHAGPRAEIERDLAGLPGVVWEPRDSRLLIAIQGDGDSAGRP